MTTTPDIERLKSALLQLSAAQQVAVEALAGGATQTAAAEAAGVARETVTRWSGHSPAFKAALNRYRSTVVEEQVDTACRIRSKALSAIETALDEGEIDPLAVLRVVAEASNLVGPTVPEAILDGEMNRTRYELPPIPPPRTVEDQVAYLSDPGPSDIERAETATITRLAEAAGLGAE